MFGNFQQNNHYFSKKKYFVKKKNEEFMGKNSKIFNFSTWNLQTFS
jgi:hypothetical protein